MRVKRVIIGTLLAGAILLSTIVAIGNIFTANTAYATTSNTSMSAQISPSYTIEISSNNVALNIAPSPNGTFDSDYITVTTYTNTNDTCTVVMTTNSTNLVSGNNTIPTLEESTSEANFANDHWGFRVGSTGNYNSVIQENTISTYNEATGNNGDDSNVYFGAKLTTNTKAGTYTGTVNFAATCAPSQTIGILDLEYMQDFATLTSNERVEVLASMTTSQQYQLMDNRDNKTYYISKLADGNVWMTQNLDHDIVTTENFYTYANTDIGHGSTPNTSAKWTADTATYATNDTTWSDTLTEPESYDPGDLCWNGTLGNYTIATGTTTCGNDKHMHIGNYYNWTAAVAMNNSSSYETDEQDVDRSICPAGWRLPTYSGDKSYADLVTTLSLTSGTSGNVQNTPVYFVYGGYWIGGSDTVGGYSFYWSSVVYPADYAYGFDFDENGRMDPQTAADRSVGCSVRCVAR